MNSPDWYLGDDLERWKSRVIQAHDWSDMSLEIAATRGSEPYQLLSGQALLEAAARLRMRVNILSGEHEAGNLLFMDHGNAGYEVAVLGPEWEVVRLIGPTGAKQKLEPSSALTKLLHSNRQRRDSLETLGQGW